MPVSPVSCGYPGPRESVHIKLLVSPVSFSHNNVRLLMVYSLDLPFPRLSLYRV